MAVQLKDTDRRELNKDLKDLQELKEDIEKALRAGVPSAKDLHERVSDLEHRIKQLKAEYFANKA